MKTKTILLSLIFLLSSSIPSFALNIFDDGDFKPQDQPMDYYSVKVPSMWSNVWNQFLVLFN